MDDDIHGRISVAVEGIQKSDAGGDVVSWPVVALRDVTNLITCGVAKRPEYVDEGVPFLSAKNVKNGEILYRDYNCVSQETHEVLTKHNKPEKGDILYTRVGSVGEAAIIEKEIDFSVFVSLTLIKPKHDLIENRYLKYLLNSASFKARALGSLTGIGVGNLNVSVVREYPIPLPPLKEQKRIAAILDKADAIRRKRQQAIQLADEFLRSVFLDMFGDPVTNPKGFPMGTIRDLVETANYGSSAKASEFEGEFPILRMGNITYEGAIDLESLKYINLDEKDKPKYLASKGDLLFNRTNSKELVGKTAVYEEDCPMAIAGYLIRIRPNEKGNNYYLSGYLNSKHGKSTLFGMCKSIVGMANINAQEVQDIKIMIPPIELQNRYEKIVQETKGKLKTQKTSMGDIESMFSSLSQNAFSGSL